MRQPEVIMVRPRRVADIHFGEKVHSRCKRWCVKERTWDILEAKLQKLEVVSPDLV